MTGALLGIELLEPLMVYAVVPQGFFQLIANAQVGCAEQHMRGSQRAAQAVIRGGLQADLMRLCFRIRSVVIRLIR